MTAFSRLYNRLLKAIKNPKRAIFVYKQPLTKKPSERNVPVSDLFVWRNSKDWKTFFELVDIFGLFEETDSKNRYVTIVFYDCNGNKIIDRNFNLVPDVRTTLDFSDILAVFSESYGTFCVFHSETPDTVTTLGSFLAERGYVSYRYKDSPLRSYVHGNLDAVAYSKHHDIESLGSTSILSREYRLQYQLSANIQYEIAIVNSCNKSMSVSCVVLSENGDLYNSENTVVAEKGSTVFPVSIEKSGVYRVLIKSKFVMARPLVFCIDGTNIDVFHG